MLTPVCVFLGASIVPATQSQIDITALSLVLAGALLAHISVNTLNEYADFKSGLDATTRRTAFSGGSGALPENPDKANAVLAVGLITFLATLLIGLYFVRQHGVELIPVGVVGLLLIATYTSWINRYPLLCLIAPGIAFGLLMVVGTQFVLQGEYQPLAWLVGLVPFFLVNNLLLLNQYPDIRADARVGRNHLTIAYGIKTGNMVFGFSILATMGVVLISIWMNYFPRLSLISLLPMPLAFYALIGAVKHGEDLGSHPQYLGANVVVVISSPLLLGVSLILR